MIIRKTYPELTENHINPLCEILRCHHPNKKERIATYNDSKKNITFRNKSRILFRYCETEKDADRFQGTEVDCLFIDEATHQSESKFKKISACVRGVNNYPKRVYLSMNPGGEGHQWVKRLFIDKKYDVGENANDYMFIQSLVTDNKVLMDSNPEYVKKLEALPPKLRKAWLEGRWDVFEGAFFEEFRVTPDPQLCHDAGITEEEALQEHRFTHVIKPFNIPSGWKIYRSYDFGFGKPFAVNWYAVDYEGIAYMILELYGCTGTPNEGVKWSPEQQFKEIARIEKEHPYLKGKTIQGVADPSIWDGSRGIAIIEEAEKQCVWFDKGINDRIPGWMQIHERLKFDEYGHAMLYIFENCKHTIRTIPLMMYDEHKPEDLDTDGEDHCLTGDTQVLTDEGYKSLESLVETEGLVMSHDGKYHRYFDVRLTRKQADIYAIELEDGTKIYCTDDHRFMLPNGEWEHTKNLLAGMEVMTYGSESNKQNSTKI